MSICSTMHSPFMQISCTLTLSRPESIQHRLWLAKKVRARWSDYGCVWHYHLDDHESRRLSSFYSFITLIGVLHLHCDCNSGCNNCCSDNCIVLPMMLFAERRVSATTCTPCTVQRPSTTSLSVVLSLICQRLMLLRVLITSTASSSPQR